jgi:Ca-activated chloride channel family protein
MRVEHIQVLWFLLAAPPVLVAFFWWALRSRQKLLSKFIEARLLTSLTVGVSTTRRKIRFALVILAVELLIFALARPQHGFDLQEVEQRGLDIVVAVDTSKSMLATDIAPNRLERAKLAALDLMQKDPTDRLGLVAFAGEGFLECPLTVDNNVFEQSVRQLNVNSIPEGGSAIATAIDTALTAFKEGGHQKALVLFTDGEDNADGALEAAQNAAKEGLKIFTIGIGTTEGTLVQVTDANGNTDYIRDEKGQVLKSKLNEPLLQQIASVTGGFYLPLRGANTIDTLYDRGLSVMPKTEGKEQLLRRYHDQFQWFLIPAILLLLVEMFFPERKRERKVARRDVSPAGEQAKRAPLQGVAGLLILFALMDFADRTFASPQTAWLDYKLGLYTNAMTEYERLAEVNTNDMRLIFNAGVAAYRATNYDEAVRLFTEATLSPDLKMQQQAYYNLGNTKYRVSESAKDLDALLEAWEDVTNIYERAVDLNKQDTDAAFNLAFVKNGVEQLKEFREAMRRAKSAADDAVRKANYHRALEIMESLAQNKIAAKQFEDYTKKLKDIDAIATPHQP